MGSVFVCLVVFSGNANVNVVVHVFDPINQMAHTASVDLVGPGKIKGSSAEAYVMAYGFGKGSDGQFGLPDRANHRVPTPIRNPPVCCIPLSFFRTRSGEVVNCCELM